MADVICGQPLNSKCSLIYFLNFLAQIRFPRFQPHTLVLLGDDVKVVLLGDVNLLVLLLGDVNLQ